MTKKEAAPIQKASAERVERELDELGALIRALQVYADYCARIADKKTYRAAKRVQARVNDTYWLRKAEEHQLNLNLKGGSK